MNEATEEKAKEDIVGIQDNLKGLFCAQCGRRLAWKWTPRAPAMAHYVTDEPVEQGNFIEVIPCKCACPKREGE